MGEFDEYPEEGPEGEALLFDAEYAELETLQRRTGLSAQVMIDLQKKGPIYTLTLAKRAIAIAAMNALIDADPRDAPAIAAAQQRISAWVHDCEWIKAVLEDGRQADEQIAEIWGETNDDRETGRKKRRSKR